MNATEKRDANLVSLLWAGHELAGEIADLHGQLFEQPWDAASVTKMLEHPGSTTLVARTGFPKASIGFAMAQMAADEAEILSIGVVESWQGAGLGKRLLQGIERALVRAGVKRLFLEVADDNAAAIALYHSLGLKEAARRKGYYARKNGASVDAIVMHKALG